ncbi:MAG: threonylcarbamoyl-AMP synthase [Elusimicrobia bacterium]|nr:threonylcarbamoyl-AMP synthase [Elusimicrobiota bacterium]
MKKIDNVLTVKEALKKQNFDRIVEIVKSGGIIVFPTDTVYGIGASVKFPKSVDKIYSIKKRPRKKPIPILISSWRDSSHIVGRVTQRVRTLMKEYWPGPVTLILSARARTVALRVPNHKFALKLLAQTGPMAVTSANISGKPAPSGFQAIDAGILQKVDMAVKDEKTLKGVPSTILDVTTGEINVVREG